MTINKALFSSDKSTWETPLSIFEPLRDEFGINLDVCALPHNAKCNDFITPDMDALKLDWLNFYHGEQVRAAWMNPPYGRQIGQWIKKAYEESKKGLTVVCLLPARTDTAWFHDYIYGKAEIRFIRGRIKFVGAEHGAPFPSMVVIFRG